MEGAATTTAPARLGAEAVELLRRLVRVDTVNPPGNERAIQEALAAELSEAGFECELLAAEPERPNLLARLRGGSDGPTLTLLGHVDTVRADPDEWTRDPWGAELAGGEVWGRGALDMKGQVAAEVAAGLELARSGWRPASGELLLTIVADEETGGGLGARWLCEHHPDRVRSDFVVNEGGGGAFELGGRRFYTLSVGEKGIFRVRLRVEGRAGHASMPRAGENALLKLSALLGGLERQPPAEATPEGIALVSQLLGEPVAEATLAEGVARLREQEPLLCDYLVEPMIAVTLAPVMAKAGKKANVIPSDAEALIDCRVPPGLDAEHARRRLAELIGEAGYELEFSEAVPGTTSPVDSPLADAIGGWLAETDPGAALAPTVMPGFSDSHWLREAFPEAAVYGFCPHRELGLLEAAPLLHGADERVPVADVELAAGFFFELSRKMLG